VRLHQAEYYMQAARWRIGFATMRGARLVSVRLPRFRSLPSPETVRFSGSSSTRHSSTEFLQSTHRPSPFGEGHYLSRVSTLTRHHTGASTSRRHPAFRFVPSSGVRSLTTVCSAPELAGLFHPATELRIHPVQGLLPPCSHPPSSGRGAPLSFSQAPLATKDVHGSCLSTSRLCSTRRSVSPARWLTWPPTAPLFGFHAPPGALSSRRRFRLTRNRPLMMLTFRVFARALT